MDFINETGAPAELFRSLLEDDERMLGVAVAKATYRIGARGELTLDTEAPFGILLESQPHPLGEIPTDMVPWKRGADVFVLGNACAPGRRPVTAMTASVRLGAFSQELAITGDRTWIQGRGGLVPGAPRPFVQIPLTLAHAYGGKAKARGAEIPNGHNPLGKGFLLDEAEAPGAPLPNIEDPAALVRTWHDRPLPLTFAPLPLDSQLRADDMLVTDPVTGEVSMREVSWNSAHPKLRPPALDGGEEVEIRGMTHDDPLRFTLPRRRLALHVWLEERRSTFPLRLDTLAVFVEERRLFTVHRCHFTYRVIEGEARLSRLREEPARVPSGAEP